MYYIFFHSPEVEESRALLRALGVESIESADFSVAKGADSVRVVLDHTTCIGIYPNFSGYPTVILDDLNGKRALGNPKSWETVESWAAELTKPLALEPARTISQGAFLRRLGPAVISESQRLIREGNDDLAAWQLLVLSEPTISLDDPLTVQGLDALVSAGLISEERKTDILTP